MTFLQQLQNLVYATITTSVAHLPYFPQLFLMASVFVLFFGGVALLFTQKKHDYLLFSYFYVGIAAFVMVVDIFARLKVSYLTSILSVALVFLLISVIGFWHQRRLLLQWAQSLNNDKVMYGTIALVVVVSTFFLSKFIYNNGLHDEYQHHAVVEDMLKTDVWPIKDEFRYGLDISDWYHYGWYYVVIFVSVVFSLPIESALDVTKLFLFIPILPLFYAILRFFFKQIPWQLLLLAALYLLFGGPILFFMDAYSGNVLFVAANSIVYQPLFFQLAGVSWYGILFFLAFSMVFCMLLQFKKLGDAILFVFFSTWSLVLLNRAYLLMYLPVLAVLLVYTYSNQVLILVQKHRRLVPLVYVVLLFIIVGVLLGLKLLSPYLFDAIFHSGSLPFLRRVQDFGFPYEDSSGLAFAPFFSLTTLRAFGLIPLFAGGWLSYYILKKPKAIVSWLVVVLFLYVWIVPVILNFSGSELALNKFYIPAVMLAVGVALWTVTVFSRKVYLGVAIFLLIGLLSPLLYFSSLTVLNSQRYWDYSDSITEYLQAENRSLVIGVDDFVYGKYLINTLDVQLVSVYHKKVDVNSVADFVVLKEESSVDEPVAQTETHFLYKK